MALKDDLTEVRYYTQADPYIYTTDNRPLTDLHERDEQLADELEARTLVMDVTGAATCTINKGPSGWTLATNGTGDYTVTHNLNDDDYVVIGNIFNAAGGILYISAVAANSFSIKTTDLTGTAAHLRFHLIVSRY